MRTDEYGGDLPITKMDNGQTSTKYPGLGCPHCPAKFFNGDKYTSHVEGQHPDKPRSHSVEDDVHRIDYHYYATPVHPHWFILSDKQSGKMLSNMNLSESGEVKGVETHPKYQRQGLASKLWDYASSLGHMGVPAPKHSSGRTKAGEEWAKKVGGELPARGRLLSARQMNMMIDFSRDE